MAKRTKLKIGDRVFLKEIPSVFGVIVSKLEEHQKPWSVHWYECPRNTRRRDMRSGRGVYTADELIKDTPKKPKPKTEAANG